MIKHYQLILFTLLSFHLAKAQDSISTRKVKILPVPAIGYSPETKTYVGAVTLLTFDLYTDSTTRTSNAKVEFNYTWNKQIILESGWNYFLNHEKWFTQGLVHYSHYPDLYYGTGPNTPQSNELTYTSNRWVFDGQLLKSIGHQIFTGLNIRALRYAHLSIQSANPFPELTGGSTFGVGYSLLKDSRDNLLTPTRGTYIYFNSSYNFSANNYVNLILDMRHYKTWKGKYTLSGRLINKVNTGHPPFYDLAFLGGDKYVRGYYYGRYRDNNLSSLQAEFRLPVYRRWGLALLGGMSELYSNANPATLSNLKYNYGTGIRFLVDKTERINLRLDYALGNDQNSGFYISFGESF
jgi:outer membrane protein assembly factor BamA